MNSTQNAFISECNDVIRKLEDMRRTLPTLITTQAHDSSALDGRLSGAIGQVESVRDKVTSLAAVATGSAAGRAGDMTGSAGDDLR